MWLKLNINNRQIFSHLSTTITFILLGFSVITVYIDINRFGLIDGLQYLNHFVYVAYTFNIIIFGVFLTFLFLKYKSLGLPIFLISYCIWEGIGILNKIVTYDAVDVAIAVVTRLDDKVSITEKLLKRYYVFNLHIPYPQFLLIGGITLVIAIFFCRYNILSFKLNPYGLLAIMILYFEGSPRTILDAFIPNEVWFTVLVLIVCYFSIKPYKHFWT